MGGWAKASTLPGSGGSSGCSSCLASMLQVVWCYALWGGFGQLCAAELCCNAFFGVGLASCVLQSCPEMLGAVVVSLPAGVAPRREPLVVEKPEEAEPAPV